VRVVSDIAEGFEQKTDRNFARYLYDSKGGAREVRVQLEIAVGRKYLTGEEKEKLSRSYEEIARMLRALIDHLTRSDWKDRR
jgi:four helix bundle protein